MENDKDAAFSLWFGGSKYTQVILPTSANRQCAKDGFDAGRSLGVAEERERAAKVCDSFQDIYPTDIFPADGESLDCKSAKMARITAKNCAEAIRKGDPLTT